MCTRAYKITKNGKGAAALLKGRALLFYFVVRVQLEGKREV